jgi:hypothetical protein
LFLSFKNEKYDNLFYEELDKMPKTKEKESLNSYDKFLLKKGKKDCESRLWEIVKKDPKTNEIKSKKNIFLDEKGFFKGK